MAQETQSELTVCVWSRRQKSRSANCTSPVGCAPGRAAKGASPVTSTKKKNSAFMRGFSFCIQETDSPAALGLDTSALSRLRGPRKKAQHFFGERRSGGECAAEAPRPPREQSLLRRRDQEVVADAIAPSANDCYSVPYKSRHLNQKEKLRFYAVFFIISQFAVFKLSARAVSARAEKNTNHSIRLCY